MKKIYNYNSFKVEIINNLYLDSHRNISQYIIEECTELSKSSFASQGISESDVSRHILDSSTTIIARDDSNNLCGFGSSVIKNIESFYIIYFQSIVISNAYKRTGLRRIFLPLRIIEGIEQINLLDRHVEEDQILLAGRTQNPLVYRTTNKKLGLYPNPDGAIDDRIKSVGRAFAKHLYDEDRRYSRSENPFMFDRETFVAKSAYKFTADGEDSDVSLYGDGIPFSNDAQIDNYMKQHINWRNGDALIMLGYYHHPKVRTLLGESQDVIDFFYTRDGKEEDAALSGIRA